MTSEITNAELRTKCAEAMGWSHLKTWDDGSISGYPPSKAERKESRRSGCDPECPNYPESDAAVRELRESLSEEEQATFVAELIQTSGEWETFKLINTSPRDQAIAFLKTRGVEL